MTLAERTKARRDQLGLSQPQLFARLPEKTATQQAISDIERGKTRRPRFIRELARALECSEAWLLGDLEAAEPETFAMRGISEPPAPALEPPRRSFYADGFVPHPVDVPGPGHMNRNLPVYGNAVGGADGRFEMNGQIIEYVHRPPSLESLKSAYGVYVQGESMEKALRAGWLLHVAPGRPTRTGDYVVVQVRGEDEHSPPMAYIKELVRWSRGSKLVVLQYNPPMELEWDDKDVVSVHRVVGIDQL